MALESAIFKARLALADIAHRHDADLALPIARHPSQTDEGMTVRLAAHALQVHEVRTLCGGEATLACGAGLSDPDEPDPACHADPSHAPGCAKVENVPEWLAVVMDIGDILADHPDPEREDILAVLDFGARLAHAKRIRLLAA